MAYAPRANYASSTYSTSTTSTEKPLLSSSCKSSNPWKKTKQFFSEPQESIDQAFERKAREKAERGEKSKPMLAMGIHGFGPFNDRKQFSGRA